MNREKMLVLDKMSTSLVTIQLVLMNTVQGVHVVVLVIINCGGAHPS